MKQFFTKIYLTTVYKKNIVLSLVIILVVQNRPSALASTASCFIMSLLPADVASNINPPKSRASLKHLCANSKSFLLVARSASCFHFCSD